MITEYNIVNWLEFMCKIIPNKEDKRCITKFINNHRDKRDDCTGSKKYTSVKIYYKYYK